MESILVFRVWFIVVFFDNPVLSLLLGTRLPIFGRHTFRLHVNCQGRSIFILYIYSPFFVSSLGNDVAVMLKHVQYLR